MRLGVRVYIVRQGKMLFLHHRDQAGQDALQAPTRFDTDGGRIREIAFRLVKESTGLDPIDVYSCGMVFFRSPKTVDVNLSVWLFHDRSDRPPEPADPQRQWLQAEPDLAPEIPELDRLWLPFVLRREEFTASITFSADGAPFHHLVRAKRPAPQPPQE